MLVSTLPTSCQDLKKHRILVVGDVMIDHHFYGSRWATQNTRGQTSESEKICKASFEAKMPGGAARVAAVLASLGCKTSCVGVVGTQDVDDRATFLRTVLKTKWHIEDDLVDDQDRLTTLKVRIHVASDITRADRESIKPIKGDVEKSVLEKLKAMVPACSAVLIQDYEKGMTTSTVVHHISDLAKQQNIPLIVGPKFSWDNFENVRITAILPDLNEFFRGALRLGPEEEDLPKSLEDSHLRAALDRLPEIDAWCITLRDGSVRVVWRDEMDGPFEARSGMLQPVGEGLRATVLGGKAAFIAGFVAGFVYTQSVPQAARFGSLVAETQVRGKPDCFVSFEDVKAKSSELLPEPPEHVPLVREWEQRVYDQLRNLKHREIKEVVPGLTDDASGALEQARQKIEELLESSRTLFLVIGGPGSGKTTLVQSLLGRPSFDFQPITTAKADSKVLNASLRAWLRSGIPIAFIDELLNIQDQFLTCSGSLMSEGKILLDGKYVPLKGGQKIIATGDHIKDPLAGGMESRFREGDIIEVKESTDPLHMADVFGLALLGQKKEVTISKAVLWAVLRRAKEDNATGRDAAGWGRGISKSLNDFPNEDSRVTWNRCGLEDKWLRLGSQMQELELPITFRRAKDAPPKRAEPAAADDK